MNRKRLVYKAHSILCKPTDAMFKNPAERPRKLHELSSALEIPYDELRLNCVYCKGQLTETEVLDFAFTDLTLVYRDDTPHGVCAKCLRFYSKVSEFRWYRYSVYGTTLEKLTNKGICDLLIRCITCQRPLCPEEKQRHLDKKRRFHNIGGRWTGRCIVCWRRPRTETQV